MHSLPKGVLDFGPPVLFLVSFNSNVMQIAEVLEGLVSSNIEHSQ